MVGPKDISLDGNPGSYVRIRNEDIALVRERSAIDEIVGEHLQLRRAGGGSLKGLCPFHDEKTPSFQVTPARGLFYCCLLYTSPSPRDRTRSRMPSSA